MSDQGAESDVANLAWTDRLDEQELLRSAQAAVGLTDFGPDDSFREGLSRTIDAVEAENPSAYMRADIRNRMLHQLTSRLRFAEDERQHPEIADIKIEKPIFLLGLPRSGTTVTFDMMALDERFRWPRDFEWLIPWPATEAATIATDPRIAILKPLFDRMAEAAPDLAAVQRIDVEAPGECNSGLVYHFSSTNLYAEYGIEKHAAWLEQVGAPEGLYRNHRRMAQQMSWKGPKGRWMFKSPQHLLGLDQLFDVYPDASLVWTHRDPISTFSSLSSMLCLIQRSVRIEPDPIRTGAMVSKLWGRAILNGLEYREKHPESEKVIVDLAHRDIVRDPVAQIRKVYAMLGLSFTEERAKAILDFQGGHSNAQRLGKHKHHPEEFGIDPEQVRRDLEPYYKRFGQLFS